MKLSNYLEIEVSQATDSHAQLVIRAQSAGQIVSYQGKLSGPKCRYARTLPSTLAVKETRTGKICELLVTDPCYWSPRLPFLYRFELEVAFADGKTQSLSQQFGLRRWETFGASLRLEGRRVVLRGGSIPADDAVKLADAYQAEIAGIVVDPSEALLAEASAAGVNILADLRGCVDLPKTLRSLSWEPAATFAIVDPGPQNRWPITSEIKLLQALNSGANASDLAPSASGVLIELQETERPPSWLADCRRPVIVRRKRAIATDCVQVRAACDRLQAELAPKFDFAGYFVG